MQVIQKHVDLAKLCGAEPAGVICEIINEDGTMARVPDLIECAKQFDIKMITIEDLIAYRRHHETLVTREVEITLPTDFGTFHAIGYSNSLDTKEHIALVKVIFQQVNRYLYVFILNA